MTPGGSSAAQPGDDAARLAAVVRLVDEVAHDLNNALLVIRGFSTVLRTTLDTPQHLADVDEITKAADHAASLTRRLLGLGQSAEPAAAGGGTETILLVEDDQPVRDLVCRILEAAGYRVLATSRPSEAEPLLERDRSIDLLLSDVVMPEMTGFELASRVRSSRPELRMLFMSGNAYVAASTTRIDAELLKKPFTPDELAQAVRRTLDAPAPAVSA
jgi:CheY-like chemotaxis protein